MKKFLKYFLVVTILSIGFTKSGLAVDTTSFSDTVKTGLAAQYLKCFSAEDQTIYATKITNAVTKALASKYCQCNAPDKTGTEMIESNQTSTVEGRAELYTKDALEDDVAVLNKQLEQLNGAVMGTAAGDKFAALKAKRDALRNGVQSWYDHSNLTSRSTNVDCSKVRGDILLNDSGISITSYNSTGSSTAKDGFTTTDTSGNQTFITPTDVFVADSQKFSDSAADLLTKCLASCKTKGGNTSDCNKMCNVSRCGCRDTDNNGTLEAVCEAAQFGPECLGVMSCNVRMCDDSSLKSGLASGNNLSALVAKYYPSSNSGTTSTHNGSSIKVAQINVSKKCTTGGCDITLTSTTDNQLQASYLNWGENAQDATLVTSLMATNGRIELTAGKPTTVHLNTSQANELQLSDGTRIECLSCNGGDNTLANRFSTGCDKTGETNPHAECKSFYGCGMSEPTYACYNFSTCGVSQCSDYAKDANGQTVSSTECKAQAH
jgi:hypothetical protein